MKKTPSREDNLYSEMDSKETNDTGIYELVGASDRTRDKESSFKQSSRYRMALSTDTLYSERSDTATVQRILIIVIGVVLVSFLTSSSTLVLAIYNISARNIPKATNCACDAVQGKVTPKHFQLDYTYIWQFALVIACLNEEDKNG